jgi:hypothetical protein
MSLEKPSRIPENHKLPLDIREQAGIAKSGESDVWKVTAQESGGEERHIALKQNRREAFATDEEMQKSKEFYEFLKAFPGFGKFVPETLYFKARVADGEKPQSFAIQSLLEGRTLDEISDEELYKDLEVVAQLLEFAHAAIDILQQTREEASFKPDFGTAGTASTEAQKQGNGFGNSRFTTNVLIANQPDDQGRRVFFVDTGVNADERVNKLRQITERHITGRIREFNFNRWIKKLEAVRAEEKQAPQ